MITMRNFKPQDYSWLYGLYVDAMKGHIEQIWGWDEVWQKNDFSITLQAATTYIIESGSDVLGYFQLELAQDHDYLKMFILDKRYRSKGIGSIVLHQLIRESQAKFGTLKLRVFRINTSALRFYQREGWQIFEIEDDFYLMEYKTAPSL